MVLLLLLLLLRLKLIKADALPVRFRMLLIVTGRSSNDSKALLRRTMLV